MPYSAGMAGYSGEKSSLPSQSDVLEILMGARDPTPTLPVVLRVPAS
jgi:hypothetical protein